MTGRDSRSLPHARYGPRGLAVASTLSRIEGLDLAERRALGEARAAQIGQGAARQDDANVRLALYAAARGETLGVVNAVITGVREALRTNDMRLSRHGTRAIEARYAAILSACERTALAIALRDTVAPPIYDAAVAPWRSVLGREPGA